MKSFQEIVYTLHEDENCTNPHVTNTPKYRSKTLPKGWRLISGKLNEGGIYKIPGGKYARAFIANKY